MGPVYVATVRIDDGMDRTREYRVGGLVDLSTSGLLKYLANQASALATADLPTHVPRSLRMQDGGSDQHEERLFSTTHV